MRTALEAMVATVEAYPLCSVIVPAQFRPGLSNAELDRIEASHGVVLGDALRSFYAATNGFAMFWKAVEREPGQIERYVEAAPTPRSTYIDWDIPHGIKIAPLETMLTEKPWGQFFLTERDPDIMRMWAGREMSTEQAASAVVLFDDYLAEGNPDGAIGLLMAPDADPRVVGITDSGMIDPQRPWTSVSNYLALILAMGGETGSRYEHTGIGRPPPGELRFSAEEIAQFGRDIFRRF